MRLKRYIEIGWLPKVLTLLLIGETLLFNHWFNIDSGGYVWRCVFASLGLGVLLFYPALFFGKRNYRYLYLFLVSIVLALIFISQFLYYKYSGGFLQASSLMYADQAGELGGTIKTLLSFKLLLFILPLIVIIGGYFLVERKSNAMLSNKEKIVAFLAVLIVFCLGYGIVLRLEQQQFGDLGRLYDSHEMYDQDSLVAKVGIVNFYLENIVEYAVEPRVATAQDTTFLTDWASGRTLPAPGADFAVLKGKDLIFIQVESLENWVIGYKINGTLIAPNLTALSEEGTYFSNYYSQDGVGNTADAEFSTLNSLYPLPNSVAFITHAENQYAALPSLLDAHGYDTAVMHGDVATFWNRSNAYPPLGYEKQFSQSDYTIPRPVGFDNLGDDDFFQQSLPKLEALPQPFMATLITLSTHTPFILPTDLQTLQIPKDTTLTPTQQQYVQAVHYSDQALGNFIAGLKKDGLYDNSLIVIYGDHGAFIGTPDSAIQHVPMIILSPGNALKKGTNTTPASHIDVYPTVADLLGIQYPITALGQDLFTTPTPVVTQRVSGTGAIKFILTPTLKYTGSTNDVFTDGTCISLPASTTLPVASCKTLYDEQVNTTKASDLVVNFNLLSLLKPEK